MAREKLYLGIGLVIGIVIATIFFHLFAPRYATVKSGSTLIKQDRWSGKSWRFVDNQWKKTMSVDRDWQKVDQALREALRIPTKGLDTGNALSLLREKYSVFKDIGDDELLERIKIVYSKEILCNLYLSNFLKLENVAAETQAEEVPASR